MCDNLICIKGVVGVRRLLCLGLALLCALTAVGCSSAPDVSAPSGSEPPPASGQSSPRVFALAYSREDTLNPYTTAAEANLSLAGLLYDSLTVIDADFMPQKSLAAAITATDATHIAVTLREGAVFSDGSAVTPADVTASFEAAKKSAHYDELLAGFVSASADRAGVITFTLKSGDPNAAACLSFPVLKAATLTNEPGKAPLGGGDYVYTVGEDAATLVANPHRGKKPTYASIPLRNLPNTQSMYYGLASGNITYYYNDLNTGDIPRVTGASAKVNMNALVYLGVNGAHEVLSQPTVRQAMSRLVDRAGLTASGCAGWALPATGPFHPAWGGAKDAKPIIGGQDLAGALELLGDSLPKKLTLELIYSVDSGNRGTLVDMLRTQLESAGIRVTATPLAYAEYMARLKSGDYDLYLGEIRLTANMDLSPMLDGGEARFGVRGDDPAAVAYRQYRAGEGTLDAFIAAFGESMPYVPLCWRCGFAAYDRRLLSVTPHGFDPYYNLGAWY